MPRGAKPEGSAARWWAKFREGLRQVPREQLAHDAFEAGRKVGMARSFPDFRQGRAARLTVNEIEQQDYNPEN